MIEAEISGEKQPIYLDDLDEELVSTIKREGRVELRTLAKKEFPEHRYGKIWRRVRTLAAWGQIHVGIAHGKLICYPMGGPQ